MTEQHPVDDVLLDLALTDLDQANEDLLSAHLEACPACRGRYTAVVGAVESLLAAAPAVPPPPGFSGRVLGAMGLGVGLDAMAPGQGGPGRGGPGQEGPRQASPGPVGLDEMEPGPREPGAKEPGPSGPGPKEPGRRRGRDAQGIAAPPPTAATPVRQSRTRRRAALLVAAVLVVLAGAVGVGIGLMIQEPPSSSVASTGQLVTADGSVVGTVQPSRYEGEKVVVVQIDEGGSATSYTCRFVRPDGTTVDAGTWDWQGQDAATWIVPLTPDATSMQVVTETGAVWATATL